MKHSCLSLLLIAFLCHASVGAAADLSSSRLPASSGPSAAMRPPSALADLPCEDGIIYKVVDGKALELLFIRPTEHRFEQAPVMLFVHGGGWSGGNRYVITRRPFWETMKLLSRRGVACASIEYRLVEAGGANVCDSVADAKDAGRYLVKNAKRLGIDPARVGVWGGSAGGHLSLLTALPRDEKFPGDPALRGITVAYRCVAAYYPLTTIVNPDVEVGFLKRRNAAAFLGGPPEQAGERSALLSPAEHLTRNSPPILLLHGDEDKTLSVENSRYLMNVGRRIGADVRLVVVHGAGHVFSGDALAPKMEEIDVLAADFISDHLTR